MTCANCGRLLYQFDDGTHDPCIWCRDGLSAARACVYGFIISTLIWWVVWRFTCWVLS